MIQKAYVDTPAGQIHVRTLGEPSAQADLYCFHPAPFSGLAFSAIMPFLAQGRRVIAPDLPGHGGSYAVAGDLQMGALAEAMGHVIGQWSDKPADLFGFHSGALVAAELRLSHADKVRRIVLCDVPAFEPDTRANMLADAAAPPGFTPELESLSPAWERGITRRIDSQGMERSFVMFVEQLRHGEAMNAGFHAAFSYAVEERLAQVTHDTTIIATQSGLLDATRRAARLIPSAKLVERLDITRAVLDEAAEATAQEVLRALD